MKKTMMAVAALAMVFVLAGCGGSPSSVAKKFANAVIQRDTEKALACYYTSAMTGNQIKALKEHIEEVGKDINDYKLEATVYGERILVPREDDEYRIVNGKKITKDKAQVAIQFVKGKDKKAEGFTIDLLKVDGSWLVEDFDRTSSLDTSDK